MFTGLVEIVGTVSELLPLDTTSSGGNGCSMTISDCAEILTDALIGDSICVNGTCLTITALSDARDSFKLGIMPETLRRTNLGKLAVGSAVNLERAMSTSSKLAENLKSEVSAAAGGAGGVKPLPSNSRFGGHLVQGHVDCTATIVKKVPDGNALGFTFKLPEEFSTNVWYIVEKGFITVDGASLTVTHVDHAKGEFGVMLIAYTQEKVVTAKKEIGDLVNIEVDQVGKYVEKSVEAYLAGNGAQNEWLTKFVENIVEKKFKELQG
ncbi:Riboflavin synthase alpha chain [Orbilia javanica]|uniref:Riboflavin synthase n=1 Tax=Orbilia javanica TaxID=47235 RepID=A0AAN8RM75_9PEZI